MSDKQISSSDAIKALGKNIGGYFKNVGLAFAGRKVIPAAQLDLPKAEIVSVTEEEAPPPQSPILEAE